MFDARHRLRLPELRGAGRFTRRVLGGWQTNGIGVLNSSTPFTAFDATNVSLQASHPPVNQWLSRDAFRRLNPATEAGRFGNAGRNIARGPGLATVDFSLFKSIAVGERRALQLRAECFNLFNHANFAVPVSDLNSANFGRVLEAGPARLIQFAMKFTF